MENNMDYLGIVGTSFGLIATPDEVQRTYNDTTDHELVVCKSVPGVTVNNWLSQLPDNRGKMTANYSLLTKFFQTMSRQ